MFNAILAGAVLAVLATAPARASTVGYVEDLKFSGGRTDEGFRYVAAAGEANALTVAKAGKSQVTFTDPGATIAAGANCTAVDVHTVTCAHADGLDAQVDLGDMNDTLDASASGAAVDVKAGPGDDALVGGASADTFDLGPGKDAVKAGGDEDTIIDSDTDPDVIDGGSRQDEVSFAKRSAPLVLADGKTKDGDQLSNVEKITGTRFDDQITTGDTDDAIDGGAGDDTIDAGAGDDLVQGGEGADILDGGDGDDTFETGRGVDRVQCGAGSDTVDYPDARDYLTDCESLPLTTDDEAGVTVSLTPKRIGSGVLRYRIRCGDTDEGKPVPCVNALTIADTKGRVLAVGHTTGAAPHRTTDLTLTSFGRKVGAAGVKATGTIRLAGETRKFTFTFRLP